MGAESKRGLGPKQAATLLSFVVLMGTTLAASGAAGLPWRAPTHGRPVLQHRVLKPSTQATLYTAPFGALSWDQQLTLTSLQGLANRSVPQIYYEQGGDDFWLTHLGVPTVQYKQTWSLIGVFRSLVKGIVVYDTAVPATIDLATTLAGLDDLLVASPAVALALQSSYQFPITVDLRGMFHDDLSAQTWAYQNLWPRTSHAMLVQIDPSTSAGSRDFAIANKAMVIFLHKDLPGEHTLLANMCDQMPPDSPYIGWFSLTDPGSSEVPSIRFLSQHGIHDVGANNFANMSAFSKIPAPIATSQPSQTPTLANKVYVTFTMSDGDNLSFLQQDRPNKWSDPARGTVPINWTVNPLLVDYAPLILSYYQQSATPNDYLLTGPSGPGYTYPSLMPTVAFSAYALHMASVLHRAGMSVPFIQNNSPSMMLSGLQVAIIENAVAPLGVSAFVFGNHTVILSGTTPIVVAKLVHSVAEAQSVIQGDIVGWNATSPLFVSLYLNTWSMGPKDAATIAQSLGSQYQVVRADQMIRLVREAYGLPLR